MRKVFDTKTGEFTEVSDPPKNRARFIEIPTPNTVLSGKGPPADSLGNPEDFYIDTAAWLIYQRDDSWGEGVSIVGPHGERGERGDSIKGETGERGPEGRPGEAGPVGETGPLGSAGKDGVDGKDGINGRDGVDGKSPPPIEMGKSSTHIQWRYKGDSKWTDLMLIPKSKGSSGGGGASADDVSNILVAGSNITLTRAAEKITIASTGAASGGHTIQEEGTPLTQRTKLNFVGANVTATDDAGNDATVVTIGGGAVDSVNGQTGVVVLDTGDITEAADANYVSDAQLTVLGNTSGTNTGDQLTFKTIAVSGQSDIVADTTTDTMTFAAGAGITLTTNAGTDTLTIASSITQYTDELAQDAVGGALTDGTTIDFTYNDGANTITAEVKTDSLTAGYLHASATSILFGRSTAGAGAGEEIACTAAARTVLDDATVGAMLVTLGGQPLDATLTALAAYSTNGIICQTAADTFAGRTLTAPAAGISVSNGDGVSGNPTLALANDLSALEGLSSTGIAVRSASDTWVQRSLAAPAAGFTITNNDGVSGNPTFVLANDLSALEAMSSTGLVARTASETYAQRTLTGGGGVTVTNGDGVSGNPTLGFSGLQTIWVPATAISPSASGGCAALAKVATSANHPDISSLDFDTTTQEYAQFSVRFPKGWDEGTITAAFHWSHAATASNFGVRWGLQGVACSDDDTIDAAFGTAQEVTDTGGTTSDLYVSPTTSAITIAGTPAAGDQVFFRVYRDPTNGADTMAVDARLMGVTIFYTATTLDDT